MIHQQTKLKVADNSGAKIVKCIKVLGGFKRKVAKYGETIIISIQQLRKKSKFLSKVRKGELYKAVILKAKKKKLRKDGSTFNHKENSVFLLNKQGKPLATRIICPITKELKTKKLSRLINISTGII